MMRGFAEYLADMGTRTSCSPGPSVDGVADDPEGAGGARRVRRPVARAARAIRARIHLACISTTCDEAAAMVNALQRHAAVVVQKSLAEGFGLTVTEAMWKGRPVIGSAVGGIVNQIIPGETGLLLADPHDLTAFAAAVSPAPGRRRRGRPHGRNGRRHASEHFLGDRHLLQYAELFATVIAGQ